MKYFYRLLSFVKPYSGYAVGNMISNVFYTIFSLVSIAFIIPVLNIIFDQEKRVYEKVELHLSFADGSSSNIEAYFNYQLTLLLEKYGELNTLYYICIAAAAMFLLKNIFRYMAMYFLAPLRSGIIHDVRKAIHQKCLNLPVSYFSEKRKGDIMARMSTDVTEVEHSILSSLESVVREPLLIIGTLVALVYLSPQLTWFVFLVLPISGFIISTIGKSLKRSSDNAQSQLGTVLSMIEETLGGLRVIKAFNAEGDTQKRFEDNSNLYRRIMIRVFHKKDLSSPISEVLGASVMLGVVWYGGKLILVDGELTGGALIGYVGLFYQIIPAFKAITQAFYNIQKGNASGQRIFEVIDAENTIVEVENPHTIEQFNRSIEFKNVNFTYDAHLPNVLSDVSFSLEKGKTIALVGPSGSGKTTISNLLPRFYDIQSGQIIIDGIDLKEVKIHDLRNQMGVVNQESILFNDSIYNNIKLGVPNATEEEVINAAKVANAWEFIEKLENGIHTNIGEGGNKLSGGQKQRVSIARAVLSDPPIMILDEATSALDTESEKLVQDALNKLMANRTSLIIAHRLSTIQHADEILVLEDGKIVERGHHEGLLNQGGLYHKLCQMQSFV